MKTNLLKKLLGVLFLTALSWNAQAREVTFTAVNGDFGAANGFRTVTVDGVKGTFSQDFANRVSVNGISCVASGQGIDLNNGGGHSMIFETLNTGEKITSIKVNYKGNAAGTSKVWIVYGEDITGPSAANLHGYSNVFTVTNGGYASTVGVAQNVDNCDEAAIPFATEVHKVILAKRLFFKDDTDGQFAKYNDGTNNGFAQIESPGVNTMIGSVVFTIESTAPDCISPPAGVTVSGTQSYCQNDIASPLTATPEGGDPATYWYQWYSNGATNSNTGGTAIEEATSDTYTPLTTTAGTTYYYVEVSNGSGSCTVASAPYDVTVNAVLTASSESLVFTPGNFSKPVTLEGTNLTGGNLTLATSKGFSVSPQTITVIGGIVNETITVTSDGTIPTGSVSIDGLMCPTIIELKVCLNAQSPPRIVTFSDLDFPTTGTATYGTHYTEKLNVRMDQIIGSAGAEAFSPCLAGSPRAFRNNDQRSSLFFTALDPQEKITSINILYRASNPDTYVVVCYGSEMTYTPSGATVNGTGGLSEIYTISKTGNQFYTETTPLANGSNNCTTLPDNIPGGETITFPSDAEVHAISLSKDGWWVEKSDDPEIIYVRINSNGIGSTSTLLGATGSNNSLIAQVIVTLEPLVSECILPPPLYYRTSGSGTRELIAWESSYDGTTWDPAEAIPSGGNEFVSVEPNNALTINSDITFRSVDVKAGGGLIVDNGNTLTVTDDLMLFRTQNKASSVENDGTILIDGKVKATVDFDGGDVWYFVSFPFDIASIEKLSNGMPAITGTDLFMRKYDAVARAQRQSGWTTYAGSIVGGEAYIMWAYEPLVFEANGIPDFSKTQKTTNLSFTPNSGAGLDSDAGWNFIVHPMFSKAAQTVIGEEQFVYKYIAGADNYAVTDCTGNYTVGEENELSDGTSVLSSYFVKITETAATTLLHDFDVISLKYVGIVANENIVLKLKGKNGYNYSTKIRVLPQATAEYNSRYDAPHIMASLASTPQIYSLIGADKMAIKAVSEHAVLPIGLRVPAAGEYTLAWNSKITEQEAILRDGDTEIDMNAQPEYTFSTDKAGEINDRFTVSFVEKRSDPTNILQYAGETLKIYTTAEGILIEGLKAGDMVKLYDVTGRLLQAEQAATAVLQLKTPSKGVYLLNINEKISKVIF